MRPSATVTLLLAAALGVVGCEAMEEAAESQSADEASDFDAQPTPTAVTVPAEQIGSCVEQIKFGAFAGEAVWSQIWSDVGQTDAAANAYCAQVGSTDPAQLLAIHDGWLQVEAFLASPEPVSEPAPAATPAPTERPPDIAPSGPDLNCADIGRKVWVGTNDYHELDANADGWGCDSYG